MLPLQARREDRMSVGKMSEYILWGVLALVIGYLWLIIIMIGG